MLFPIIALGLATLSSPASAAPVSAGFCQSPGPFICGNNTSMAKQRQQAIAAITQKLKRDALQRTAQILGEPLSTELDLELDAKPRARRFGQRVYLNELRQGMRGYLAANGVPLDFDYNSIRTLLLRAVSESPEIPAALKPQLTQIVSEIRFVSVAMADSEFANTNVDAKILQGCRDHGLEDNAFSTQRRHGERVIVVCPGYVIGSVEYAKAARLPRELMLSGLVDTIAHEIGHQFDGEIFPAAYPFTRRLLETNRGGLRAAVPVEKYMSESTADFWGNRVLHYFLEGIADPALRDLVLRGGISDLCGSEDEGIHPSGAFRLQVLAPAEFCAK